jgi:outer membrane lipoprotein-sorting protein
MCCVFSFAQNSSDTADTATRYLQAWTFKDYATMYRLSSEGTRKSVPEQAFYAAAAKLRAPAADPQVVRRTHNENGSDGIYLQYTASGSEVPARTSIGVAADGVTHSELLAHAATAATTARQPSAATNASGQEPAGIGLAQLERAADPTAADSIDGLTADAILGKMQNATQAVETLKADLVIHGSMMGQSLNESGKLIYRAPNNIRVEAPKFVLNGNGDKTVLYMPELKAYMDLDAMTGDFEIAPGIGTPVAELRRKYNVSLVGKAEIDGVPVYQLSLKPPSTGDVSLGALMGGIGGGAMRLWVSSATWLPVRAKISSLTADYRNMQVNKGGIDENSFVFSPPKGAEELNLGSLLGGLTAGGKE